MPKERILLSIVTFKKSSPWSPQDIAQEMEELVKTCGGHVVDIVFCRLEEPSASTYITKGKVEELTTICSTGSVDTVIFSCDLKGSQQRNLEDALGVKTIDRTQLILDIFARHAKSSEGKMQVELAQLEYLLPRLVGKGIELSRLGGGIGTMGPGETKLEVDRRRISDRIAKLKKDLSEVSKSREIKRKKRQNDQIPLISLVGYTNAGKSTLLNTLTRAGTITNDGLFTTLDSLSRQFVLPSKRKVVFSDTVGFMHDLPHRLIESFKATLEEVQQADLLLHVIDISHPNHNNYYEAVMSVLGELKVLEKPVITVLNKIDKIQDRGWLAAVSTQFPNAVLLSGLNGENLQELLDLLDGMLSDGMEEIDVKLPIDRMDLVNLVHKQGKVHTIKYLSKTIRVHATLPKKVAAALLLARI
ncbi:MAG: GTPase HflX [Candidatus Omnitrophica bacterium]|nr:GTPase HflX [Candidatus Omnitrophota bacterium]